jgi:hypothetical protein
VIDGPTIGVAIALDDKLRNQLVEARENISAQLEQLERGVGNPSRQPDFRDVYADLQRGWQLSTHCEH